MCGMSGMLTNVLDYQFTNLDSPINLTMSLTVGASRTTWKHRENMAANTHTESTTHQEVQTHNLHGIKTRILTTAPPCHHLYQHSHFLLK